MLQIKIVSGMTDEELTTLTNEFLQTIPEDSVKEVDTSAAADGHVTVKYVIAEEWKGHLCCDCRYWDDGDDCESMIGLCQECGGRRRFNQKSCQKFKDVRGCR